MPEYFGGYGLPPPSWASASDPNYQYWMQVYGTERAEKAMETDISARELASTEEMHAETLASSEKLSAAALASSEETAAASLAEQAKMNEATIAAMEVQTENYEKYYAQLALLYPEMGFDDIA